MHLSNVFTASADSQLKLIATGSVAGEVVLWSLPSFRPELELVRPDRASRDNVVDLAFDRRQRRLLVMPDWKGAVEVWDLRERKLLSSWSPFTGRNYAIAVSPTTGFIATLGADLASAQPKPENALDDPAPVMEATVVRLWDGARLVRELSVGAARGRSIVIDETGARMAASAGGAARVWNLASGEVVRRVDHGGEIARVDLIGDELCCVGTKGSACYGDGKTTATPGASAAAVVGLTTSEWVISATYEAVEIRRRGHAPLVDRVKGRAYDVVESGGAIWIVFTERLVEVRKGRASGVTHALRASRQ